MRLRYGSRHELNPDLPGRKESRVIRPADEKSIRAGAPAGTENRWRDAIGFWFFSPPGLGLPDQDLLQGERDGQGE